MELTANTRTNELVKHVARRSGRPAPKRNFTRALRAEQTEGRRVVCSMAPYEGAPVFYSPRYLTDPRPWRLAGPLADNGYRFSGRECHTIDPR